MFGLQNLGVINQKNAPAIWESPLADFPTNFVKGRILIDNTNGDIYLDTTTTRHLIQNGGELAFRNGLTKSNINPFLNVVKLGGSLDGATIIDINGNELSFIGLTNVNRFDAQGVFYNDGNSADYMPIIEDPLGAVVPNVILNVINTRDGSYYKISAEKV
jgi:hypothetical protein